VNLDRGRRIRSRFGRRDTGSEGGGFGARLSDALNMNSTYSVGNTAADMSAMQSLHMMKKECGPARGESGATKLQEQVPARRERRRRKGGGEAPAVLTGDIGRELMPNNRACGMLAMRRMHAIWNSSAKSTATGSGRSFNGDHKSTAARKSLRCDQGSKAAARTLRNVLPSPRSMSSMRQTTEAPSSKVAGLSTRKLV
jgi:hypothetical protein